MDVKKKMELDFEGVYVLLKDGLCVYVGESENVPSRIGQHLRQKEKDFDEYRWYSSHERKWLEKTLIEILQPKYNVSMNTGLVTEKAVQRHRVQDFIDECVESAVHLYHHKEKIYHEELKDFFEFEDHLFPCVVEILNIYNAVIVEERTREKTRAIFDYRVVMQLKNVIQNVINELERVPFDMRHCFVEKLRNDKEKEKEK